MEIFDNWVVRWFGRLYVCWKSLTCTLKMGGLCNMYITLQGESDHFTLMLNMSRPMGPISPGVSHLQQLLKPAKTSPTRPLLQPDWPYCSRTCQAFPSLTPPMPFPLTSTCLPPAPLCLTVTLQRAEDVTSHPDQESHLSSLIFFSPQHLRPSDVWPSCLLKFLL